MPSILIMSMNLLLPNNSLRFGINLANTFRNHFFYRHQNQKNDCIFAPVCVLFYFIHSSIFTHIYRGQMNSNYKITLTHLSQIYWYDGRNIVICILLLVMPTECCESQPKQIKLNGGGSGRVLSLQT